MGGFGLPADPERLLEGEGTLAGFLGAAFLMDEALGEFSEAPTLISSRAAAQAKRIGKRMMIS